MGVHDLGYRDWGAAPRSERLQWWVIAQTGARLAWRSRWLRRMMFFAWLPAFYLGAGFFAYERSLESSVPDFWYQEFMEEFPESQQVLSALAQDAEGARHLVWSWLLLTLLRYTQAFLMLLLIGLVGPPLIARDVRSRAFLLYFSRPLSAWEYVLGKATVLWMYIAAISTLPALTLYVIGVLLSPDLGVVADTWDLPLRILGASALLMLPTSALMLMFSSLTTESRYAGFAWFATWVLGWVTYIVLTVIEQDFENFEFDESRGGLADASRWSFVSLYHMLGHIQGWVFGVEGSLRSVWPSLVVVIAITIVSTVVLLRRVIAQVRI